ncbi:MAG: hypothetical protein D6775_17210 [Caldilineae bacterium]|nr:MAG: hypothetical protein D6775_17210 [Caldilineae bacterium]
MTTTVSHPPTFVSLTTDFGWEDGYVAAMKGVIYSIQPAARVVDITHSIGPQNVVQAAYVLASVAPYFPAGTVHVVVVDPGVGTDRRPLAVFCERACYVGPDNGVFTLVYGRETVKEIRVLANEAYRLPQVSHTFHGRDIFAPFAAHIAAGVEPHTIGPVITDPVKLNLPEPRRQAGDQVEGEIVYVDHFGNLISNIPLAWFEESTEWVFEIGGVEIAGLRPAYGFVAPGELVVLGGSTGLVEVAVRNGSAAERLRLGVGARVRAWPRGSGDGQTGDERTQHS